MQSLASLFILSLIARRPTYGYQIKQFLTEANADEWMKLSFTQIYQTLGKLKKGGLVEVQSERSGLQPQREVYSISDKGKEVLIQMLVRNQYLDQHVYFEFDPILVIISGMRDMPDEDRTRLLKRRIENVERAIQYTQDKAPEWQEKRYGGIPLSKALTRHRDYFLESELRWLKEILTEVENVGWAKFAGTDRRKGEQ